MTDLSEFDLIQIERALEGCEDLKDIKGILVARAEERDRIMLHVFGEDFRDLDIVLHGVPRLIAALRQGRSVAA